MLRIHFTAEDLVRVRIAAQPDALWETVLSLFRIRQGDGPLIFGDWRRRILRRAPSDELKLLLSLVPGGYFPDFLNPVEGVQGIDAGLESVLLTPKTRVRSELDLLGRSGRALPARLGHIRDGDRDAWSELIQSLRTHHDLAIAPHWDALQSYVDAERAKRAQILLTGGTEGLLNSFRPLLRWEPPVLEADFGLADQDLQLEGRGLLLVPSFFSLHMVDTLRDPTLPPVLVYPMERDLSRRLVEGENAAPETDGTGLAAVIGATRARILFQLQRECSTSDLAVRTGVTSGAVSQHTGALRQAGLILTTRVGRQVVHTLTPLGRDLLRLD